MVRMMRSRGRCRVLDLAHVARRENGWRNSSAGDARVCLTGSFLGIRLARDSVGHGWQVRYDGMDRAPGSGARGVGAMVIVAVLA